MPRNELLKPKVGLAKRLVASLANLEKCEEVNIQSAYKLSDKKIQIPASQYPLQIFLGAETRVLHLYPEPSLKNPKVSTGNFILFDPEIFFSKLSGFVRLEEGEEIILGQSEHSKILFPDGELKEDCRLLIRNKNGTLIFKSLTKIPKVCISPLLKKKQINQLLIQWRRKLRRISKIFDGKIRPLDPTRALQNIRHVNKLMEKEAYRPFNAEGKPGGIIELPDHLHPIILGDLHGKTDNLLAVLVHGGILDALENDQACLIILGDAVHSEEEGRYEKMGSSLLIMDMIFQLKLHFPKSIFYLRGNHDSFSTDISKGGVLQGRLWERKLRKTRGKAYRNEMERYYQLLPCLAWSKKFIACHAAAPVSNTNRDALININNNKKLLMEVINNRLYQAHRPGGYTKSHVKKLRNLFNLDADTPFIVGHTPLSQEGALWENVGNINHHTVVYSAAKNWVGAVASIANKMYPIQIPCNNLSAIMNQKK